MKKYELCEEWKFCGWFLWSLFWSRVRKGSLHQTWVFSHTFFIKFIISSVHNIAKLTSNTFNNFLQFRRIIKLTCNSTGPICPKTYCRFKSVTRYQALGDFGCKTFNGPMIPMLVSSQAHCAVAIDYFFDISVWHLAGNKACVGSKLPPGASGQERRFMWPFKQSRQIPVFEKGFRSFWWGHARHHSEMPLQGKRK